MIAVALLWRWRRWAAVSEIAFRGRSRVGEPLRALRHHLLLPTDLLDAKAPAALCIENPKSAARRGPRVQHVLLRDPATIARLEAAFQDLMPRERLYAGSVGSYRKRWGKILDFLQVPATVRLTPGGLRGGGAVAAYRAGVPLPQIQWQMRLRQTHTLEHYIQEVAALTALSQLTPDSRRKVAALGALYDDWSWSKPERLVGQMTGADRGPAPR